MKHSHPASICLRMLLSAFLAAGILSACGGGVGRYKLSDEVGQMFRSFQPLPAYTYYFAGPENRPTALLAIDKNYVLTSADLWTRIDADAGGLGKKVKSMSAGFYRRPYGFTIADADGKTIGFYYSAWDQGPVVLEGGNRVSVYLPDPATDLRPPKSD